MLKLYIEYWDTEEEKWKLSKMAWWKAIIAVLIDEDCSFAKVEKGKNINVIKMSGRRKNSNRG